RGTQRQCERGACYASSEHEASGKGLHIIVRCEPRTGSFVVRRSWFLVRRTIIEASERRTSHVSDRDSMDVSRISTARSRMDAVQAPIVQVIGDLIRRAPGTISLGQGVVHYGPPRPALDAVRGALE